MKKILILLALVTILLFVFKGKKEQSVVIPESSIRFRILANSNSPRDQKIKEDIKNKLQDELYAVLKDSNSLDETRTIINNNLNNFDNILSNETKNLEYSYEIDYGMHLFPQKEYKGVTYNEGYYESLLVTLGKGEGNNFWCVLFPPLCVIEAEESNVKDVQYKFFIKEIIEKYF